MALNSGAVLTHNNPVNRTSRSCRFWSLYLEKTSKASEKKYDPVRYLIGCLDDKQTLDDHTLDEECDIFINELGVYLHGSLDRNEGLKKFIQKIRSPKKRRNRHFEFLVNPGINRTPA